jgi:hypothetical protein
MKRSALVPLVFSSLLLLSCSSAPKITKVTSLVPLSEADTKVTKNGVTIEVIPLSVTTVGAYPQLSTTATVMEKALFASEPKADKKPFPCVLPGVPFAIKVSNNTGHILKMAGSDIGLTVSGVDVRKMSKEDVLQWWAAWFPNHYEHQRVVPTEIVSTVKQLVYWDESLKVLPGKQVVCFATFNTGLKEGIDQASLAVYDLVTKSDQAGNPTERTNFEFNLKELTTEVSSQ